MGHSIFPFFRSQFVSTGFNEDYILNHKLSGSGPHRGSVRSDKISYTSKGSGASLIVFQSLKIQDSIFQAVPNNPGAQNLMKVNWNSCVCLFLEEGKEKVQELIPYQHLHQKSKYFKKSYSIVNEIPYLDYQEKMQKIMSKWLNNTRNLCAVLMSCASLTSYIEHETHFSHLSFS